jgi:hypothetical protein
MSKVGRRRAERVEWTAGYGLFVTAARVADAR